MDNLNRIKKLAGILTESVAQLPAIGEGLYAPHSSKQKSGLTLAELVAMTDEEIEERFLSGQIDQDAYEEALMAKEGLPTEGPKMWEDNTHSINEKSKSEKQARFMAAAAHDPKFAKRVGIKQNVAKEFNKADTGTEQLSKAMKKENVNESSDLSRMKKLAGILTESTNVNDMVSKYKAGEIDYDTLQQYLHSGPAGEQDSCNNDYTDYTMRQGEMGNPDRFMEDDTNDSQMDDLLLNAIAALYGDDIWENDAMQDLANDLESQNPTMQELNDIISTGSLPPRLQGTKFTSNDDVRFGGIDENLGGLGLGEDIAPQFTGDAETDARVYSMIQGMSGLVDNVDEVLVKISGFLLDQGSDNDEVLSVMPRIESYLHDVESSGQSPEMDNMELQEPGTEEYYTDEDEYFEETYELENGYGEEEYATGDDYFPDGADSPVTCNVGPSGARQGDNPSQKRMAVDEAGDEVTDDMVSDAYEKQHNAFANNLPNKYQLADYASRLANEYAQQQSVKNHGAGFDPISGNSLADVRQEVAETHKELVYAYRNFLKESKK